jgi:hypothetical protein
MKSTFSTVMAATVIGLLAGVAVGYWEARPWTVGDYLASTGDPAPGAAKDESSPGSDSAKAKAVAPEILYNFGNMESGATQRHTFPLRNEGQGPLTVTYVSHTCKCTEVKIGDKSVEPGAVVTVPPGDELGIMLEWAAKVPPGPFRHGAAFSTTDDELKRLELTVEGEIVTSTTLEPSQLDFGFTHVDKPGKAEMVVMAFLEPKVEILSHEVLDEKLAEKVTVSFESLAPGQLPNPQAKAGVKVIATYDPKGTLGPFGGSLRLTTNIKKAPQLEVPIIGSVKGDISIFAPAGWNETTGILRMPTITSATGGKSQVFVTIRGEHAATTKLSLDRVDPEVLKATLGEPQKLRDGLVRVPLTIEVPPGTRPMARMGEDQGGEGEIVLATTHPGTSSIRLRVYFTVQP